MKQGNSIPKSHSIPSSTNAIVSENSEIYAWSGYQTLVRK